MIVRKATAAALTTALLALCPAAVATELTPDGSNPNDPNGPPPMPPPMPPPGQPGSVAPPPPAGSTEAHLAASDQQDNGIGLKLFYIQPELGFGWASIGKVIPAPSGPTLRDYTEYRSGAGPALGLGAGFQFITIQLGARARTISTPHWNLWNVGGELMYQPGSGRLWPRFGVNVGYAWAANFKDEVCAGSCGLLDVGGLSVGARGGVQYFVSSHVEVGADATFDYLSLKREAINGNPVYGAASSGSGVVMALMGHLGIHLP